MTKSKQRGPGKKNRAQRQAAQAARTTHTDSAIGELLAPSRSRSRSPCTPPRDSQDQSVIADLLDDKRQDISDISEPEQAAGNSAAAVKVKSYNPLLKSKAPAPVHGASSGSRDLPGPPTEWIGANLATGSGRVGGRPTGPVGAPPPYNPPRPSSRRKEPTVSPFDTGALREGLNFNPDTWAPTAPVPEPLSPGDQAWRDTFQ